MLIGCYANAIFSKAEIFIHIFMILFLPLFSPHALCIKFSNCVAAEEVQQSDQRERATPKNQQLNSVSAL